MILYTDNKASLLQWLLQPRVLCSLADFCGHHLLAAKLRPSNVDPAAGALEEVDCPSDSTTLAKDSDYCARRQCLCQGRDHELV